MYPNKEKIKTKTRTPPIRESSHGERGDPFRSQGSQGGSLKRNTVAKRQKRRILNDGRVDPAPNSVHNHKRLEALAVDPSDPVASLQA